MSRRSIVAVLVLALVPLVGVGAAVADEPDPDRAMLLFGEAKRLHEEGRVRESMAKLQEAYEAYPSEAILVSIVNRHLDLGELEQAAELLEHIDAPQGKLKRKVQQLRRRVERGLATPVTVRLTANAEGATVSIDDGEPMLLPARVDLPRGRHRFAFRAEGRSDVDLVEMLTGMSEIPISANLSIPIGRWRVTIEPPQPLKEIRLLLDGKAVRLGRSEMEKPVSNPRDVIPGKHKLTCLRGYDARADADFTVASGDTAALTCKFPEQTGEGYSMWAWITGGVGLAALATGAGVLASWYVGDAKVRSKYEDSERYEIKSSKPEVGWTLVGVGAATGVVSGLFFAGVLE